RSSPTTSSTTASARRKIRSRPMLPGSRTSGFDAAPTSIANTRRFAIRARIRRRLARRAVGASEVAEAPRAPRSLGRRTRGQRSRIDASVAAPRVDRPMRLVSLARAEKAFFCACLTRARQEPEGALEERFQAAAEQQFDVIEKELVFPFSKIEKSIPDV